MPLTHLAFEGGWETCASSDDCASPVHVELSIEEARLLPTPFVYGLAEIVDPPRYVEEDGTKQWYSDQEGYHRDYDLPAEIWSDDTYHWYQHGKSHRDGDRPAVVHPDGYRLWYQEGREWRADGKPTRVYADGGQAWFDYYEGGQGVHRVGAPAMILADGTEKWYQRGQLHREDGPAVVYPDGGREYWFHGKLAKAYSA